MATPDLNRIAEHYHGLPDDLLLDEYRRGPGAFAHPQGWELLASEVRKRGLKSAQNIAEDLERAAAVEANPDLANTLLFCEDCVAATNSESAGDSNLFSLFPIRVGDTFVGRSDVCPICGSYIARMWFVFVVPIFPSFFYRIIDLGDGQFVSRQVVVA